MNLEPAKLNRKSLEESNMEDYSLGDTLEYVNYWALVQGKQIMACKKRIRGGKGEYEKRGSINRLFLWCKSSREPAYKRSAEGYKFSEMLLDFAGSSYVADVEYLVVPGHNLALWERLYAEGLFPYWDPEGGPLAFFVKGDPSPDSQYIAIYRVYRIDMAIRESDVIRTRPGAVLRNTDKLNAVRCSRKIPIYERFEWDKDRIIGIVNEFRQLNRYSQQW